MFIVLIHWRIKPNDEAKGALLKFWTEEACINDDNGLVGEFLSEPIPANEMPFRVDPVLPEDEAYWSFVNVGIWKDFQSFQEQVGRLFDDTKGPQDFEQLPRRRIPLTPLHWRIGKYSLPEFNNLRRSAGGGGYGVPSPGP